MKKTLVTALIVAIATLASPTTFAREGYCKITEPKGGPLNVRATPDGKIVTKLKNGKKVVMGEIDYDSYDQPWVQVFDASNGHYLGWVFREYITCY